MLIGVEIEMKSFITMLWLFVCLFVSLMVMGYTYCARIMRMATGQESTQLYLSAPELMVVESAT